MARQINNMDEVRSLYEISLLIGSDLSLKDKLTKAVDTVCSVICCDAASLFLMNYDTGSIEEISTIGTRVDLIGSIPFDMGTGFSAWVAKQRQSVIIPALNSSKNREFKSFMSTPLLSGDTLVGVINLGHKEQDAFNDNHMKFLEIIARQLAIVVERTNYELALVQKTQALEQAHDEIRKQQERIIDMEKHQAVVQIAASVNHEINNPLTSIIGNAELILISNPDIDESTRKKLQTIKFEAQRIAEILEKLRNVKNIVVGEYLGKYGDMMIDIDSSTKQK